MIETDTSESIENTLNLVFINAYRVSRRASIGWALLDDGNGLLTHNSMMAGANLSTLPEAIKEFGDSLDHLLLSVEPGRPYCDLQSLIHQIELSNCLRITIGYRLPQGIRDVNWTEWVDNWHGEVSYSPHVGVGEKLASGIRSILLANRPWVTAISASTIENQHLGLTHLLNEFGFRAYLDNLVVQSGAILYSPTQQGILETLPRINRAGQVIDIHEVEDASKISCILKECALRQRYSVLLLCDPNMLSRCAELNMVDEIYHHIAIANMKQKNKVSTPEFLKLENWTIASSDVVGNCIRMSIKRNDNLPRIDDRLRRKLN